jgi:hypothetical protein
MPEGLELAAMVDWRDPPAKSQTAHDERIKLPNPPTALDPCDRFP